MYVGLNMDDDIGNISKSNAEGLCVNNDSNREQDEEDNDEIDRSNDQQYNDDYSIDASRISEVSI